MYQKKSVSVNRTCHNLHASFLQHSRWFSYGKDCNEQNYKKEKGPGTSDQLLFRLPNKFRKISLSVMYYLTKFDDAL